jgi:hypothetical protein
MEKSKDQDRALPPPPRAGGGRIASTDAMRVGALPHGQCDSRRQPPPIVDASHRRFLLVRRPEAACASPASGRGGAPRSRPPSDLIVEHASAVRAISDSSPPCRHAKTPRGALAPELCKYLRAIRNQRAQGRPGARCTRGLVCKIVQRNAHEHTGSAEAIRPSLRSGFTAYSALSPATNSSCHRRPWIDGLSRPVGPRKPPADLAPATGVRTTRLRRTQKRRSSCALVPLTKPIERPALRHIHARNAPASTAFHPNVRDDRDTPLWRDGTLEVVSLIWGNREAEYF